MKQIVLGILLGIQIVTAQHYYVYREYATEEKQSEYPTFELIHDTTNKYMVKTFYFQNGKYFVREHLQNNKLIAKVTESDSSFYSYFGSDSAIVYKISDEEITKDKKLTYNIKGNVIYDYGYLYNSNVITTYTRNTYLYDTLLIGQANFYIEREYKTDITKTDSSFYTYDNYNRLTGIYKIKNNSIDSLFTYIYEHTDSSKTYWMYEKHNGKCELTKRATYIYDNEGNSKKTIHYKFPNIFDGTSEFIFLNNHDNPKLPYKKLVYKRADGSVWKTTTYRKEIIK